MMGHNSFLEEKLEYLRSVDAVTHHVGKSRQVQGQGLGFTRDE